MSIRKIEMGNGLDVSRSLGLASVPAATANGFVYTYGITAISADTGRVIPGDIEQQTRQVLSNLEAILTRAGSGIENAVSVTVYLRDIQGDYEGFNRAFDEFFGSNPVPRCVVQAGIRSPDAKVQIQIVALQAARSNNAKRHSMLRPETQQRFPTDER